MRRPLGFTLFSLFRLVVPLALGLSGVACDSGFITRVGPPIIQLNTDLVDFGAVAVGARAERSAKILSTGQTPLKISSIALAGRDPLAFDHAPKMLEAIGINAEVVLTVSFQPAAVGDFEAQVVIASDASNAPSISLLLKGTAIETTPVDGGVWDAHVDSSADTGVHADAHVYPDGDVDAGLDSGADPTDTGPDSFLLEVETFGPGTGIVVSNPAGIDCNPDCRARFSAGALVTLTASAARGSTFSRWDGDCLNVLTSTCGVLIDRPRSTSATFEPLTFPVSVTRSGAGAGRVQSIPAGIDCGATCMLRYPAGTQVTLTASPDPGSVFAGWSGDCSGVGLCILPLNGPATADAAFEVDVRMPLQITRLGAGAGTVTSMPAGILCGSACSADFSLGTTVTLTATAGASAVFGGWGGDCSSSGTQTVCTVTLDRARGATARFDLPAYTIHVQKSGTGTGVVSSTPAGVSCGTSCSVAFPIQTRVTLTASPDPGSTFVGWSGDCSGSGVCLLIADMDHTVTATFDTQANACSMAPPEMDDTCSAATNRGSITLRNNMTQFVNWNSETLVTLTDEDWTRVTVSVQAGCFFVGYDLNATATLAGGEQAQVCMRIGDCSSPSVADVCGTNSARQFLFPATNVCNAYNNNLPVFVKVVHQANTLSCQQYTMSFSAR